MMLVTTASELDGYRIHVTKGLARARRLRTCFTMRNNSEQTLLSEPITAIRFQKMSVSTAPLFW